MGVGFGDINFIEWFSPFWKQSGGMIYLEFWQMIVADKIFLFWEKKQNGYIFFMDITIVKAEATIRIYESSQSLTL